MIQAYLAICTLLGMGTLVRQRCAPMRTNAYFAKQRTCALFEAKATGCAVLSFCTTDPIVAYSESPFFADHLRVSGWLEMLLDDCFALYFWFTSVG